MLTTILLVVLILALLGVIPDLWPHSKGWGKGPAALIFIILMLVIVLAIT